MDARRILCIADCGPGLRDGARDRIELETISPAESVDPDRLDALLAPAEVALLQGAELPPAQLRRADRLSLIVHAAPGSGGLDLELSRDLGILVASVPDAATPELAGCIAGEIRGIIDSGRIDKPGAAIRPWRIGIIGFGRLGRALAKIANAERWEPWAVDPFINPEHFRQFHVRQASPADLMGICDFIVMAASPSRRAGPLVSAREIDLMRRDAAFICAGAPRLVDLDRLARAKAEGRIAEAICVRDGPALAAASPGIKWIAPGLAQSPAILRRALDSAIELSLAFFQGVVPTHLLIDPPLPRATRLLRPA